MRARERSRYSCKSIDRQIEKQDGNQHGENGEQR